MKFTFSFRFFLATLILLGIAQSIPFIFQYLLEVFMVNRFSLLALAFAVLSLSCGTPTAPQAQGNISGRVYLQPRTGQIDQAKHDITVALTGNQTYTTTSVDSGAFVLSNVNQGIYSITYSKAGYISRSMDNIQFVGNGTLKLSTVYLNQADTVIDPPDPKNVDRRVFGYVRLYDENGDSLSDHSGVNVTINGTSLTATTEKSGIFYFEKYPKGDFDVTLSKVGFQDLVIPKITFPDSVSLKSKSQLKFQKYNTIAYVKQPNIIAIVDSVFLRSNFSISTNQDGSHDTSILIYSSGRVTPSGYGKRIWMFTVVGNTPDVSIDNYQNGHGVSFLRNPNRDYTTYFSYSTDQSSTSSRWHIERAGKDVYVKAYAMWNLEETNNPQVFENPVNKHIILSGYVGSNVFKITLPTEFKLE